MGSSAPSSAGKLDSSELSPFEEVCSNSSEELLSKLPCSFLFSETSAASSVTDGVVLVDSSMF